MRNLGIHDSSACREPSAALPNNPRTTAASSTAGRQRIPPRQGAQPLRLHDYPLRRQVPAQLRPGQALSALQPLQLHRRAPGRRRVAGGQFLLVGPPADEPEDAPLTEHVRLPVHGCGSGRLLLQHHGGSSAALAGAGGIHAPDAQPFRPAHPGSGDFPLLHLGGHARRADRALRRALSVQRVHEGRPHRAWSSGPWPSIIRRIPWPCARRIR